MYNISFEIGTQKLSLLLAPVLMILDGMVKILRLRISTDHVGELADWGDLSGYFSGSPEPWLPHVLPGRLCKVLHVGTQGRGQSKSCEYFKRCIRF